MAEDIDFGKKVSQNDVEELFRLILQRPVGNAAYKQLIEQSQPTVRDYVNTLLGSEEFTVKFTQWRRLTPPDGSAISDQFYRAPHDLEITNTKIEKVLLIGSCLLDSWEAILQAFYRRLGIPAPQITRIVINNLSDLPPLDSAQFDFQILQLPLRMVVPEWMYMPIPYNDVEQLKALFDSSCKRLSSWLDRVLRYYQECGITTFVLGFATPQQNPSGRLQARYSLQNMVFFVEELNRYLYQECGKHAGVYFIDFDEIVSTLGKRYFQDDLISLVNHGSQIGDMPDGNGRLEPIGSVTKLHPINVTPIVQAVYREVVGAFRSLRQQDSVKLVIFDLDDTLWRGVAAELDEIDNSMIEGWPLGLLEAASYLWKRGILIAMVSKNDEKRVEEIWKTLYQSRFPLENFVVRKINWQSKTENVRAILDSVNILPGNAIFVDDNPVERAAVRAEFPEVRVLEKPLVNWRRILLWSPETQPTVITTEGNARTEMIKAQIVREAARSSMGNQEFLESLRIQVNMFRIRDPQDNSFDRALELLNKTNQFNTTGKRWNPSEIRSFLSGGGEIVCGKVTDSYTAYGLVVLALVRGHMIEQFVMSCRVFGMEIEKTLLSQIICEMSAPVRPQAKLVKTGKNTLCLNLFADAGFEKIFDDIWQLSSTGGSVTPAHVRIVASEHLMARPTALSR